MRRCKLPAYNWRWHRQYSIGYTVVTYQEYSGDVGPSPKQMGSKSATVMNVLFIAKSEYVLLTNFRHSCADNIMLL